MKLLPRVLLFVGFLLAWGLVLRAETASKPASRPGAAATPNPYAAATVVVFNETDRDSVELAHFYAEKRGIPKEQVIGLRCSKAEEISRGEYDKTIAQPLRKGLTANSWWKLREPERPLGPG